MNTTRPQRLPKASDLVVTGLREHIISRRLPIGAQLPSESDIMVEYQVGRVTVREALRLLERDGLIEIRRGTKGGIFVRHPEIGLVSEAISLLFAVKETTLREFVEFRRLVEPTAAALAAQNIDSRQREELTRIVETQDDLTHVPDLHLLVAESSANGVLAVSLCALHHPFAWHFRPKQISSGQIRETAAAHRKIARLILDGDAGGAKDAMSVHLDAYWAYLDGEDLLDKPIIPERSEWTVA